MNRASNQSTLDYVNDSNCYDVGRTYEHDTLVHRQSLSSHVSYFMTYFYAPISTIVSGVL